MSDLLFSRGAGHFQNGSFQKTCVPHPQGYGSFLEQLNKHLVNVCNIMTAVHIDFSVSRTCNSLAVFSGIAFVYIYLGLSYMV